MDKKYTIKDIAELAGVSKGTVDRVLHRRGKVSSKALAEVEKVLREIDYQPNPIARNLKNNKIYTIAVLLPDPKVDSYWMPAVQGIKDAAKEFKPFGVLVKRYYYHPTDKNSFLKKSKEALGALPDVLLMAPLFQQEALEIFHACEEKNVLVALFNNYIEVSKAKTFIGQDLHQSGRVAASLIHKMIDDKSTIAIVHLDEEGHMRFKEEGFKSYFAEMKTAPKIVTYSASTNNDRLFQELNQALIEEPDLSAVFVTNSKAYLLAKTLNKHKNRTTIVGYDLLEENIAYLQNGEIDFLIHQKPKRQAYLGVGYLAEYFLFGKTIPPQSLLPIDIITPENVRYHMV